MIRDDDDNAGPPHSKLVEDALVSVRIGGLHAIVSSNSKLKRVDNLIHIWLTGFLTGRIAETTENPLNTGIALKQPELAIELYVAG
ncbi:hypothetical protein F9C07_8578 [Aspergillus flavus]|uniref:Uncharacterized protein n=1 Tax=Aspergillus flavus (strain ATCC 200026 / FGSC A1120 / IAM 13836 / NRRL 3357 / JCM 12722 / SRRC 167) TaxID=332952 RepID=A0A7U2N221_ASPFN|nr:hypothetical protein F9C07_8578 [Aspergillus flavus]